MSDPQSPTETDPAATLARYRSLLDLYRKALQAIDSTNQHRPLSGHSRVAWEVLIDAYNTTRTIVDALTAALP